jgi:hypothetical protein
MTIASVFIDFIAIEIVAFYELMMPETGDIACLLG